MTEITEEGNKEEDKKERVLYKDNAVEIAMIEDFLKNPKKYKPGEGIQQRYHPYNQRSENAPEVKK